jgi:uncharacterized Zn finger protein
MGDAMARSLATLLNRRALRRWAGGRSFERGEAYFSNGQVRGLVEDAGTVVAKVCGTYDYRVKLWVEEGEIAFSCTCPIGEEGEFCKHCVAVGLAWLEQQVSGGRVSQPSTKPGVTMDDVRAYLSRQEKRALVDLVMDQVMEDDRLRRRLLMKAAKRGGKDLDLAAYRQAIDQAVDAGEFVDYRSAHDYVRGIEEVLDSIGALLKEGYAAEVIELSEYALQLLEEAVGSVDDSDGVMGSLLDRLQEIHHAACKKAKPDPVALAKRLFEWELRDEYDIFYGAAERYADVLGEKGLAVYRKLAEAEWARIPAMRAGQEDPEGYGQRFRITSIMETLARQSGDVEALVEIKKRDLSHAYAYLQIAELYKEARQDDQALTWAERGVKAFPHRTDSRLRDFLAEEYHRRGRHDEAMAQIWAEWTDSPTLHRYRILKGHADRIGQWPTWREKAFTFLREKIAQAKREAARNRSAWWSPRADHSELVRIFLWEKDIDAAWREAQEGGCSNDLWMELAAKREKEHPEEALPIYQRQIEPTLAQKNNPAYEQAVDLLRKIRGLMARLGRESAFAEYLASIRAAHKPKRNFMKLLDKVKGL